MVYKLPPAFADDCTWQQLSCKIAKNASAIEMSRPTFTQQFGGFAAVNYCNIFHCMLSGYLYVSMGKRLSDEAISVGNQ